MKIYAFGALELYPATKMINILFLADGSDFSRLWYTVWALARFRILYAYFQINANFASRFYAHTATRQQLTVTKQFGKHTLRIPRASRSFPAKIEIQIGAKSIEISAGSAKI